jgi:hypothetical protein
MAKTGGKPGGKRKSSTPYLKVCPVSAHNHLSGVYKTVLVGSEEKFLTI